MHKRFILALLPIVATDEIDAGDIGGIRIGHIDTLATGVAQDADARRREIAAAVSLATGWDDGKLG